jgi:hypothetical protein
MVLQLARSHGGFSEALTTCSETFSANVHRVNWKTMAEDSLEGLAGGAKRREAAGDGARVSERLTSQAVEQ